MVENVVSDSTNRDNLEIRKLHLESEKLSRELDLTPLVNRERRHRFAMDVLKAILGTVGAVIVFFVITREDSVLRREQSAEETKRERARLVVQCFDFRSDKVAFYRCIQTIYDAYADVTPTAKVSSAAAGVVRQELPWLDNLRDQAFREVTNNVQPPISTTPAVTTVEGSRDCEAGEGAWWQTHDWQIRVNAVQSNPEAVPHDWVRLVSPRMSNLPPGAMGSMLVLHPISVSAPAVVQFRSDRLGQVQGKTIQIAAAGSPYGDAVLQVWANNQLAGQAVFDGRPWKIIEVPLPPQLQSLEVRNVAGGTQEWYFETMFIKKVCFKSAA